LPNSALVFVNGPSALRHTNKTRTIQRQNLSTVDTGTPHCFSGQIISMRVHFTEDPYFQQPAFIPLIEETHGGEDVGIWADGPGAHLFTGTVENTYIAYAVACVLCLNERTCKYCRSTLAGTITGLINFRCFLRHQNIFFAAFADIDADSVDCGRQESLLLLTTGFSIGSFVILLVLLIIKLMQLRCK
jgi:hypothetical protein